MAVIAANQVDGKEYFESKSAERLKHRPLGGMTGILRLRMTGQLDSFVELDIS